MIKVTVQKDTGRKWWPLLVVVTFALHVTFFLLADNWARSKPREPYETSRVEFQTLEKKLPEPEPEPEPESETEPEPEIKKPRPRPNKKAPPKEIPKEQPKPVFGVTADSVLDSGSGVAVRVGNTLEAKMEKKASNPKDVKPLEPVEEIKEPVKKVTKPVPIYALSKTPSFKKKVEPKYPLEAKAKEIEGTVQLEVLIGCDGKVKKVKVIKTPGFGLEKAAIAALARSRFHPGIAGGQAVPVKMMIPYRFVLDS